MQPATSHNVKVWDGLPAGARALARVLHTSILAMSSAWVDISQINVTRISLRRHQYIQDFKYPQPGTSCPLTPKNMFGEVQILMKDPSAQLFATTLYSLHTFCDITSIPSMS